MEGFRCWLRPGFCCLSSEIALSRRDVFHVGAGGSYTAIKGATKTMKSILCTIGVLCLFSPAAFAQAGEGGKDHGETGVYANYFLLDKSNTSFAGIGGRLSANATRYLQLEGEVGWNFGQAFREGFTNSGIGTVTIQRSNLRLLDGLFGPKVQTNRGPVRLFFTVKGGFVNFRFDRRPATFATFASSVQNLRDDNVNGVLYPGGGGEGFLGPVGLRLDIGDEIYFNNGAHHNLRVAFGPHIRF
jgi:hypothetical protein